MKQLNIPWQVPFANFDMPYEQIEENLDLILETLQENKPRRKADSKKASFCSLYSLGYDSCSLLFFPEYPYNIITRRAGSRASSWRWWTGRTTPSSPSGTPSSTTPSCASSRPRSWRRRELVDGRSNDWPCQIEIVVTMPQGRLAWHLAFATVLVKGQSRDYGCHNMMYELRSEPRAMVGIAEQIMYRVRLVVWYMVWLKLIPSYVSELGKQRNALNPTMYLTTSPTL